MGGFFISAHGALLQEKGKRGATMETFIVPASVKLYFYGMPGTLLSAYFSDALMDELIGPAYTYDKELAYRWAAAQVIGEGELCYNYTAVSTPGKQDFRDPNGVYLTGNLPRRPALPIPPGTTKTLKSIVQGMAGEGGAMGSHFYWCCCRQHMVETRHSSRAVVNKQFDGHINVRGERIGTSLGIEDTIVPSDVANKFMIIGNQYKFNPDDIKEKKINGVLTPVETPQACFARESADVLNSNKSQVRQFLERAKKNGGRLQGGW
jgi:hypothetical protein